MRVIEGKLGMFPSFFMPGCNNMFNKYQMLTRFTNRNIRHLNETRNTNSSRYVLSNFDKPNHLSPNFKSLSIISINVLYRFTPT